MKTEIHQGFGYVVTVYMYMLHMLHMNKSF